MAAPQKPDDLLSTLAHHDAAINTLGGRMTGVERGLTHLQGEVHTGFNGLATSLGHLNSKLDRIDSRPQFDFHKTVSTVTTIAVLFSMVIGGVIWITTGQFAGVIAKQDSFNQSVSGRLERTEANVEKLSERVGAWITTASKGSAR